MHQRNHTAILLDVLRIFKIMSTNIDKMHRQKTGCDGQTQYNGAIPLLFLTLQKKSLHYFSPILLLCHEGDLNCKADQLSAHWHFDNTPSVIATWPRCNISIVASHTFCRFVNCTFTLSISCSMTSQMCVGNRSSDWWGHWSILNLFSCSWKQSWKQSATILR